MFRGKKDLLPVNTHAVPRAAGVYIIYTANGAPFYVGRSLVSIRDRLTAHATKRGSTKVKLALDRGETLRFEWCELGSPHQAESRLIGRLGTTRFGNLRRETDPADW